MAEAGPTIWQLQQQVQDLARRLAVLEETTFGRVDPGIVTPPPTPLGKGKAEEPPELPDLRPVSGKRSVVFEIDPMNANGRYTRSYRQSLEDLFTLELADEDPTMVVALWWINAGDEEIAAAQVLSAENYITNLRRRYASLPVLLVLTRTPDSAAADVTAATLGVPVIQIRDTGRKPRFNVKEVTAAAPSGARSFDDIYTFQLPVARAAAV